MIIFGFAWVLSRFGQENPVIFTICHEKTAVALGSLRNYERTATKKGQNRKLYELAVQVILRFVNKMAHQQS